MNNLQIWRAIDRNFRKQCRRFFNQRIRDFNKYIWQSNASNPEIWWTQCWIFYWTHSNRSQSTRTISLRHHRAETHRKSEGHNENRRYAKFFTAFRKIEIPVRKSSNLTGNTKRCVRKVRAFERKEFQLRRLRVQCNEVSRKPIQKLRLQHQEYDYCKRRR